MKQCNGCIYEPHQKNLICCNVFHLTYAARELFKSLPFLRITEYECPHRLEILWSEEEKERDLNGEADPM